MLIRLHGVGELEAEHQGREGIATFLPHLGTFIMDSSTIPMAVDEGVVSQ